MFCTMAVFIAATFLDDFEIRNIPTYSPGFFELVDVGLQELGTSRKLHQFFTLLQEILHSFLLVLHQPAVILP